MNLTSKITACVLGLALTTPNALAAHTSFDEAAQSGLTADRHAAHAPVLLAQASDSVYRIGQLEERLRVLNGRIEELSFQLLEMQEQMRRMQEDNEFRFQQLEGGTTSDRTDAGNTASQGERSVVVIDPSGGQTGNTLGTLTLNQDGELVTPEPGDQDATQTASLPAGGAEDLYRIAYGHVLAGDYAQAETGFRSFIAEYPDSPRLSDAHFWLGEAQYGQGSYHEAAKTLLAAHKQFPSAPKSPEMLLKLGMALAALDNRDTACATYREVLTRYPEAGDAVKAKVAVEQSRMSC